MQIFQFYFLNLLRSFLRSDVFIKKHEFPCIKFRGPALSQLLVHLILRSFQKIVKFKSVSVCVCVCVCVCVRAYVDVCINVTSQNNVIVTACKAQHHITYCSSKCDEISKVNKLKISKIYHLYTTQNFTCLKCCYISSSIKLLYTLKQS